MEQMLILKNELYMCGRYLIIEFIIIIIIIIISSSSSSSSSSSI